MSLNDNGMFEEMNREDPPLTHAESCCKTGIELNTNIKAAEGLDVDDLLTETDRHKMQFYMNMPDMIIKTSEWESFGVCNACKNQINIKHYCPTCQVRSVKVANKDNNGKQSYNINRYPLYTVYPIPHQRYRERYHTISYERKKPWWKFWGTYKAGEGFWEIVHIPHVIPLITKPTEAEDTAQERLIDAYAKIEELKDQIKKTLPAITVSLTQGISATHVPEPSSPPTKPKRTRAKKATK